MDLGSSLRLSLELDFDGLLGVLTAWWRGAPAEEHTLSCAHPFDVTQEVVPEDKDFLLPLSTYIRPDEPPSASPTNYQSALLESRSRCLRRRHGHGLSMHLCLGLESVDKKVEDLARRLVDRCAQALQVQGRSVPKRTVKRVEPMLCGKLLESAVTLAVELFHHILWHACERDFHSEAYS